MIRLLPLLLLPILLPATELQNRIDQQRAVAELLQESYVFVGGGSGVVVDPSGLILTNDHVAGSQERWRIRFFDGRTFPARRLGTDPFGDICLLQIEAPDDLRFRHVELGSAADCVLGTPVLAIGNPFSLGDQDNTPTVTLGMLSTGRVVRGVYTDCLQLDAAVNPGNSGGPALDLQGRLLGINGQIRTRTGMRINSGIGLAIACTQLRDFLPLLRDTPTGYVHHAGPPEGLELAHEELGVVVVAWEPRDPAEAELLRSGDLLLRIGDRPVTSIPTAEGLFAALPWTGPETTAPVVLLRDGALITVAITTGRTLLPGKPTGGFRIVRRSRPTGEDDEEERFLLVGGVDPGSPADQAGLQVGWEIRTVNGTRVQTRLDYLKVMARVSVGDLLHLTLHDEDGDLVEVAVPMLAQ